jgi:hypothetical protein
LGRCLLYQIELSEAALVDLDHFGEAEIEEILSFLLTLADNPKPAGIEAVALPEAADGLAYLYETNHYSIFYNIFESARVIKVVALFKKISLN